MGVIGDCRPAATGAGAFSGKVEPDFPKKMRPSMKLDRFAIPFNRKAV
jgi:hypothetical protein